MGMNLLRIEDLSENQIMAIFRMADQLNTEQGISRLSGKTFVLFFPESSIRTRVTFEKGIRDLGGECILFPPDSLNKRESLKDVVKYLENWADGIIARHPDSSKLEELACHASIPIINGMTSQNHPCEILSDIYTISKLRSNFKELKYTFVGPKSNIAGTWKAIAAVMDLDFRHVCLEGHALDRDGKNYRFYTELQDAMPGTDVVLTDSLPEELRTKDYISKYQVTLEVMKLANEKAILNPCPPFYRNEEVSEEVILSDYFVGYPFKENLTIVQQAVILYCCGLQLTEA